MNSRTMEWTIRGGDSTNNRFEFTVHAAELGPGGVRELLRRLTCMDLTAEEIVAASTGKVAHLEVSPNGPGWMTNGNPHYTADPT